MLAWRKGHRDLVQFDVNRPDLDLGTSAEITVRGMKVH